MTLKSFREISFSITSLCKNISKASTTKDLKNFDKLPKQTNKVFKNHEKSGNISTANNSTMNDIIIIIIIHITIYRILRFIELIF